MGLIASRAKRNSSASVTLHNNNLDDDDSTSDISTTKVFGVSLQDAVDRSDPDGNVPAVIRSSIDFLNSKGLEEMGLYRIPGDKKLILEYRAKFNRGENIDFLQEHESGKRRHEPADVAGLILQFLRELPESFFNDKFHDKFMMHRVPKEIRKQIVYNHMKLIPKCNRETIRMLVQHLTRVAKNEAVNKMNIKNIVLCMWGTSPYTPVFFTLIEDYDYVFSDEITAGKAEPSALSQSAKQRASAPVLTDLTTNNSNNSNNSNNNNNNGNLDWLKSALDQQQQDDNVSKSGRSARPLTVSFNPYRLVDTSSETSNHMMNRRSQRGDRFHQPKTLSDTTDFSRDVFGKEPQVAAKQPQTQQPEPTPTTTTATTKQEEKEVEPKKKSKGRRFTFLGKKKKSTEETTTTTAQVEQTSQQQVTEEKQNVDVIVADDSSKSMDLKQDQVEQEEQKPALDQDSKVEQQQLEKDETIQQEQSISNTNQSDEEVNSNLLATTTTINHTAQDDQTENSQSSE